MKKSLNLIKEEFENLSKEEWGNFLSEKFPSAAIVYATPKEWRYSLPCNCSDSTSVFCEYWPFESSKFCDTKDRVRELATAGAFIALEIERLLSEGDKEKAQ